MNLEAWAEFEQHRKDIRKPLSDLARTKAANILTKLSPADQQATVDRSIQAGWTGLFPDKTGAQRATQTGQPMRRFNPEDLQ